MNKRVAYCIGTNNSGTDSPLTGCMNDAVGMMNLLQKNGYVASLHAGPQMSRSHVIRVLHDAIRASFAIPAPEHMWITYAGHGTQIEDADGDEGDGLDEAIQPSSLTGPITDDELHEIMQSFNPSCKVTLLFDCCSSGSICDLEYTYKGGRRHGPISQHEPIRAKVRVLSACDDGQFANESLADVHTRDRPGGEMTRAFIRLLNTNPDLTFHNAVQLLNQQLSKMGIAQEVVFSSSYPVKLGETLL
jgi:hypothetical protein